MFLIFDTETTGFAHYGKPAGDSAQPHMIQFAAALYDPATNSVIQKAEYLIRTVDGSPVPTKAAEVHGITTEILERDGVAPELTYEHLRELFFRVTRIVAFNVKFDSLVLRAFCAKLGRPDLLAGKSIHCAMLEMKDILKIPGKFGDYKWPSLAEAYAFVTGGEEIENAHDALADVEATVVVYAWLLQYNTLCGNPAEAKPFRRPELNSTKVATIIPMPLTNPPIKTIGEQILIVPPPAARAENFPVPAASGGDGPGPAPETPKPKYKSLPTLGAYGSNQFELPL